LCHSSRQRKSLAASYRRAPFMRERVHGPFGLDAVRGQTVRCQRTVLVVVKAMIAPLR